MGEELKCQFCSLGFTSVYKIIPHIYFGHRKKVTKYVREHGEVALRCPAKCDFKASRPVDKGSGPDLVFPALSQVLAEQEAHMVERHTEESKLTVCPYCQIGLEQLVYWEHLEEHMGAGPNTKTPPKPEQPTPPKPEQPNPPKPEQQSTVTDQTERSSQLEKTNVSQGVLSDPTSAAVDQRKVHDGEASSAPAIPCAEGEPSTSVVKASMDHSPDVKEQEEIQPAVSKAEPCGTKDAVTKEEESAAKILPKEEETLRKQALEEEARKEELEENLRKQALEEEARKQALEEEARKKALEEEACKQAREEEARKKALEEEARKQALEEEARKEEEMKRQARQEEMRKQAIEEEIKKQAKQEEIRNKLKEIERKIAEKKREDKKKADEEAAAAAAAAHLKAEEECAEADRLIREGEAAEAERKAKEEKAQKSAIRKSKEEKAVDLVRSNEQSDVNEEQRLSAAVEARMKEEESKKTTLPAVTPEKPGAVKRKSGSENSSSRTSPTVGASPREEKRSPGDPVGRSRRSDEVLKPEEKTRKLSGKSDQERKVVDQEKVRRESGKKTSGGAWDVVDKVAVEKPKPVLTEEMEREIIFGSFKKEKKVEKKEEVMPPTKKVDKKESREEKLQSVRKEIEARFREEEERRRKEKEDREEKMRKEREKQRKHEEKLQKEREKAQKEREKLLKERREEQKRQKVDDELLVKEAAEEIEQDEAMDTTENEAEAEEEPPKSPEFTNPYERIKEEILKMEKEKAEMDRKRQMEKEAEEREEAEEEEEESRSPSVSRRQSLPSSTPAVEETRTVRMVTPPRTVKMISTPPPTLAGDGDDDDLDDLEMLMRDFKEAESKEKVLTPSRPPPAPKVNSLALLRDSYGAKRARSPSPKESKSVTIPSGFDADGHPLPGGGGDLPLLARATNSTALAIMGPAKKEKGRSRSSTQLECSLCKEEASATSYISAYQLLSHVFLAHRKKIVSRSRKARGMTLACPEGCGFVTRQSAQGVSIDFFNAQLPLHLESLCDHVISDHTGEDKMTVCHFCELPLNHREAWSWQHLANHRDARRQFCSTCKTFPFKTEVHKCPGPAEVAQPAKKTLEELAREVEAGVVDPEELAPQKHLGNITDWECPVCPRSQTSLSLWLHHLSSDHFGKSSDKLVFSLKCFCCTWKPLKAAQMDRGNEALAVEQLVGHLLAEHHHDTWSDPDCERERRRVARAAKEHQSLQEREKEENLIVVPRLPAPCPICLAECANAADWKYHTLAHKYGEVFCASCHKCFLGYKFKGHKAGCRELPPGVDRVEVLRETKDTWVEVAGRKARVFYEYRAGERGTVARTVMRGKAITGSGGSHDEACEVLKDEVQRHLINLKEKENAGRKEELERLDRQALLDLFIELARRDEESRKKRFKVCVRGEELSVGTKLGFTKWGATKITASVMEANGTMHSAEGETRELAVASLERAVANLQRVEKAAPRFCCLSCGSRFQREKLFQLHQDSAVCQK